MPKSRQKAAKDRVPVIKSSIQVSSLSNEVKQIFHSKSVQYALVIVVITFISFFPSLKNGFMQTWDDEKYVTSNPLIRELNGTHVLQMFTKQVNGSYVPLPLLTFAIEYKLFGDNPLPFHATNLILHILCTLLAFKLLRLLKIDLTYAAFGALLFGVHPMRVESVAWISERKDVLYSLFYLGSIIAYIRYLAEPQKNRKFLIYSILLFLGSLFSKIEAVTLPLSLLLVDYLLQRPFRLKLITEKIPYFLLSLLFGILGVFIIYRVGLQGNEFLKSNQDMSLAERVLYGLYSFSGYILKFFIPISQSIMYPYPVMTGWIRTWVLFLNPALIMAIVVFTAWSARKTRAVAFGMLFFLVNIFFLLQFFAVGNTFFADRYTYIPYFGLIFILLWFAEKIVRKNAIRKMWVNIVLSVFAVICMVLTFSRCAVWKDGVSLWSNVISQYPGRFMEPYANRGVSYFLKHDSENAIRDYTAALSIDPNSAPVYADRAMAYGFTGQQEKAIEDFSKSIGINPKNAKVIYNRGVAYGNANQSDMAILDFRRVINLDSAYVSAYVGLCMMLIEQRKFDTCSIMAEKGLKIDKYRPELYALLGNCELEQNDPDKAISTFQHCLRIDNTSIDAWLGLAAAFMIRQDDAGAAQNLALAREVAQQQNIRIDNIDDITGAGITLLDMKRTAIQKLLAKNR